MITRALFVRLEAKTGREEEVESFLSGDVAGSLMEQAPHLLASDPTIERADELMRRHDAAYRSDQLGSYTR